MGDTIDRETDYDRTHRGTLSWKQKLFAIASFPFVLVFGARILSVVGGMMSGESMEPQTKDDWGEP